MTDSKIISSFAWIIKDAPRGKDWRKELEILGDVNQELLRRIACGPTK